MTRSVESLKDLLNTMAVEIHQSGEAAVDLRKFRGANPSLAETLWHIAQADQTVDARYDLETDAAARVGMRSLLKRIGTGDDSDQWCVEFSHRSLKEFFVAQAILAVIESEAYEPDARRLLQVLHLEPVILHFLAQFRSSITTLVLTRLRALVKSAIVGADNGRLGANASSCFVALGGKANGQDWSALELDTALLRVRTCGRATSALRACDGRFSTTPT